MLEVYIDVNKKLSYKENSNSEKNTLAFTCESPIINADDSQGKNIKYTINASLISLVPMPAFTMDEDSIDFNMQVEDMEEGKIQGVARDDLSYNSWFGLDTALQVLSLLICNTRGGPTVY